MRCRGRWRGWNEFTDTVLRRRQRHCYLLRRLSRDSAASAEGGSGVDGPTVWDWMETRRAWRLSAQQSGAQGYRWRHGHFVARRYPWVVAAHPGACVRELVCGISLRREADA